MPPIRQMSPIQAYLQAQESYMEAIVYLGDGNRSLILAAEYGDGNALQVIESTTVIRELIAEVNAKLNRLPAVSGTNQTDNRNAA